MIQQERPLRVHQAFEDVFYSRKAQRQTGEPIHTFISRRHREWDRLVELSPDSGLSSEIRAQLLMRQAGLSQLQRTQILASTGNKLDLSAVEGALKMQFADFHLGDHHRQSQQTSWHKGAKNGKGKGKGRTHHAYMASEQDYIPEEPMDEW
eukprot:6156362-Amphidinium_carterae.1